MEELLVKSGVQGIRSHMVLPPRTELMEGELKQRIKEADYDAVLVIRPKAFRNETQEVGTKSVYMPPPFYQNLWPYWDMAFKQFSAKGSYLKENTMVSAEFNLYHTKDETRSEEHTSELQSRFDLVCRLLLEKKKEKETRDIHSYLQ